MPYDSWFSKIVFAFALLLAACTPNVWGASPSRPSQVGKKVEPFSLSDFRGKVWSFDDVKDKSILVIAFLGTECPLMTHYGPRLQEIAAKYADKGVAVVGINSNQQDSLAEMNHFARTNQLEVPLLKDPGNKIADQLQANRTPEIYVLDQDRVIRYQGRIDDQFTVGIQRKSAENSYLVDAVEALLNKQEIKTAHTDAVGCLIGRVLSSQKETTVSYSKEVSRILQKHCTNCHREGEVGPFALTSFEETAGWASMIREVVSDERMPPWNANPAHGKFANDARLSTEEKQTLLDWIDGGAPEGDKADLPPAAQYVEGWQIGTPDQVFYISDKGYNVPAYGEIVYQYFKVDPGFTEDKWVKMAECRPGNRKVVHHIIVGLESPGGKRSKEQMGLHSSWLAATAPGAPPMILGDGQAKLIPAGSKLVFQMHYTPNGTAQVDRSCIGLKFVDASEVTQQIATQEAGNAQFKIPPHAENHKVDAYHRFDKDMMMLAMFPHMHVRGKAFRYTAIFPDGKEEILLDVPRYDFNWQHTYTLAEPRLLPVGTKLHCEAWFDNSENNLANPDPTQTVRWGDQTREEMMLGYFAATPAKQETNKVMKSRTDAFLELAAKHPGKPADVLPAELVQAAKNALNSDAEMQKFGGMLRGVFPQLDRCCWTVLEEKNLHVKQCVQDAAYTAKAGGKGRKVPLTWCKLAGYASGKEPVMHAKLVDAEGVDLQYMSKVFHSSLHIPLKNQGDTGTLNFWSADDAAFPPEAVALLAELANVMRQEAANSQQ